MVGRQFQENLDKVWSRLMDDDVERIGVYGMRGIGKTAFVKHVNNRLLRDHNPFHQVYWVGVSQDCSIRKLQNAIAGVVGLSLPSFEDDNTFAARLWQALTAKKKSVLILDDVWEFVDLERVGIPVRFNACKLVDTSRSESVCRLTSCQQNIKLWCLLRQESWDLFLATLSNRTTLPSHVELVARSIVGQNERLPLGIVTIAKCMRGVVDLGEWRNISEELKGSLPRSQIMELFDSLKLSYNVLRKQTLKQVFVFCALMRERGYDTIGFISKQIMARYLVANGLTEGLESRQIEFDNMYHSLNLLEDAYLVSFNKST